jgi:twitching motility protein PilT
MDGAAVDLKHGTLPPPSTPPAPHLLAFEELLTCCVEQDASDIHIVPGMPPHLRVHGELDPIRGRVALSSKAVRDLAEAALEKMTGSRAGLDAGIERRGALDGALSSRGGVRFRFNIFRRQGELAIALRRLEDRFQSLGELGLPEALYNLCNLRDGLIIVSGPTGAGKSTTLATMLDRINRTRNGHLITIEDPIEYIHKPLKCVVNQRQVGLDAPTFNDALVASLRQDPDVILVGEIRDLETIRTAITAAETGHLVFTTLHAGDCVSSVERLVSVFPADEQDGIRRQLSLVLRGIIAQHLLPAAASETGERHRRVVASEILLVNPAVANLVATAKSAQIYSTMEAGQSAGMQTLEQDLARLWVGGMISEGAAVAMARNVNVLRDRAALLQKRLNGTRTFSGAGGQR